MVDGQLFGMRLEIRVLEVSCDHADSEVAVSKTGSEGLCQGEYHQSGFFPVGDVMADRDLVREGLIGDIVGMPHTVLSLLRSISAISVFIESVAKGLEATHQKIFVRMSKFEDGLDSDLPQALPRGLADQKEVPHRKWPHLLRHLFREKGMDLVGFLEI